MEASADKYSSLGLDNGNRGVGGWIRRDNAPDRTSLMVEAAMCLQDQGIDNDDGGVVRGGQARGLIQC